MKTSFKTISSLCLLLLLLSGSVMSAKERKLHIVTTGDVHGSWFARPYIDGGGVKTSLMSVKAYVDSLRDAVGAENVLLLDAGDCLQGDNAAYYYNYIDTTGVHLYPRLAAYMGYDAVVVGNHDIETGHPVYDKVASELEEVGIPWLGGNAVKISNGEPYFPMFEVFERAGLKVAVIGLTNPNMKAWLSEPIWRGMDFLSLIPYAQQCVDEVISCCNPDVVVLATHSGTGAGDGSSLESQGLDLLESIHGVDVFICAHDHRPFVKEKDGCYLINGGARAGNVGHAVVTVDKKGKTVRSKSVFGETVRMNKYKVDTDMEKAFESEFEAVKAFTNQTVGELAMDIRTRDAYRGMSDYINLVHTVQLSAPEAKISFAAPLTFDGTVKAGKLVFNDMFTVYPYENQLFVLTLKGSEIKNYLEYSYDSWIESDGEHILRIANREDPRTGAQRWSFVSRSYNFDSAAGLVYTVDITKPYGSRVSIKSLADGSPFSEEEWYPVAMTSYRASGGGDILIKGAGIAKDKIDERVIARYPAIRDMVYEFFLKSGRVTSASVSDHSVIGEWHFVPEERAEALMDADMKLIF